MSAYLSLVLPFIWADSPNDGNWSNGLNWNPSGPPSAPDTAIFAGSLQHDIAVAGQATVNDLFFLDRYAYRVRILPGSEFVLHGTVNSGPIPEFIVSPGLGVFPGLFIVMGDAQLGQSRVIINGQSGANPGQVYVRGQANNAKLYANAGSNLIFEGSASADNALILSKPGIHGMAGGQIFVNDNASIENARIVLAGIGSYLQLQQHSGPVTIGNLSGQGVVWPGSNDVFLRTTDFFGTIETGGGRVRFTKRLVVHVSMSFMLIRGDAIFGGALEVHLPDNPVSNYSYPLLHVNGQKTGTFDTVQVHNLPQGANYSLGFVGDTYAITLQP